MTDRKETERSGRTGDSLPTGYREVRGAIKDIHRVAVRDPWPGVDSLLAIDWPERSQLSWGGQGGQYQSGVGAVADSWPQPEWPFPGMENPGHPHSPQHPHR